MLKNSVICLLFLCVLIFPYKYAVAKEKVEYLTYSELISLGKTALKNSQYEKARIYFKLAHQSKLDSQEPRYYINLVKRVEEGRVRLVENSRATKVDLEKAPVKVVQPTSPPIEAAPPSPRLKNVIEKEKSPKKETQPEGLFEDRLVLDSAQWASQPNALIKFELNRPVIIEGRNIDRFLVISPEFLDVESIDKDHVLVTARLRGETFMHVWDDQGRWTFSVQTVYPSQFTTVLEESVQELAKPFKFYYSADWNTNYFGDDIRNLGRRNLNFTQWMGIDGDSPYGKIDSSILSSKFEESTEITGYTLGLSDGRLGQLKNFNIRAFDASKRFSPLTLPGKYFRGILLESEAFDKAIVYSVLWGRDRLTYGYITPSFVDERESYIEGAKITLFPYEANTYSLNYAQGYGSARPEFLKDRAYSLETRHRFQENWVATEIAHDEDHLSELLTSQFGERNNRFRLNFRDIHEDFTTASTFPSDRGEIGGNLLWDYIREDFNAYSNFDIYQDRLFPNEDHPHALNYDFNTSIEIPVSETASLRNSLFYTDTPGELSPQRNFRTYNTLNQDFKIWNDKLLTTFIGGSYQKSRFSLSPLSDFDRYSLLTGFRYPIFRNLNYFFNYEYSWADEISSDQQSNPQVFNTGLNYTKQISKTLSGNLGITYRNEEDTEALHSFLAGEDSVIGSAGLAYRPRADFEIFMDGRLRNIWAENPSRNPYSEGEIQLGMRSSWETPVSWSPLGEIHGFVFKDLNDNTLPESGEPGIEGVKIKIGNSETITNSRGIYSKSIRAKRVNVELDASSIPDGYIANTSMYEKVEIIHNGSQAFNFALTTRSGIYGVVFDDENNNKQIDPGEGVIPKVKIILDDKTSTQSDFEGSYFFENIISGKHRVKIDINSIPLEYLPQIKLQQDIEVQEGTTYILHILLKKRSSKDNNSP